MDKITLAEAVKLKSILTKKIHELEEEMRRVAFANVEKGEKPEISPRNMTVVEAELDEVRKDARTLDRLVYRANIDNEITFKDEKLAIVEAIELATQLRAKVTLFKSFSMYTNEEILYSTNETLFVRVPLYDPEEYRQKAIQLEKDAHKLSNLINAKNYSIEIEFDDSKYF